MEKERFELEVNRGALKEKIPVKRNEPTLNRTAHVKREGRFTLTVNGPGLNGNGVGGGHRKWSGDKLERCSPC